MSAITLNGLRVVSARILTPWRGIPLVDVDLDPDVVATAPSSGPATLTVGVPPVVSVTGVVDPLASGAFVAAAKARLVCGHGGWAKDVPAQPFHNDGGLLSTTVYTATGALVGETVVDLVPRPIGSDYARANGRASRVLDGVDFWVDPTTGVTSVGPRPPALPDKSLEILEWDPLTHTAILSCDALVVPGTPLLDPRIGVTPVIVRDVEQVFDERGSRATAWCSANAVGPLQAALTSMVREFGKLAHLKVYRYRFVSPAGPGKAALQAVDRDAVTGSASPLPDLPVASEWTGVPGCTALMPPSLEVLVAFTDGDPAQPRIVGYSTAALPTELDLDASVMVNLAGGASPLVLAPWATGLAAALVTFATGLTTVSLAGQAATLLAAIGALASPATVKTKAT